MGGEVKLKEHRQTILCVMFSHYYFCGKHRRLGRQTGVSMKAFDHEDSGLSNESVSEWTHNMTALLGSSKKIGMTLS